QRKRTPSSAERHNSRIASQPDPGASTLLRKLRTMQEDSALQTNVISLESKLPLSRFRSSATDFASLGETDDRIELSSSLKFREQIPADDVEMLVGIKECRKLIGLRCREILLGVS